MLEYSVPDEGAPRDLSLMVSVALAADDPWELRLYVNDLVPQRGTVLANYVEATFAGYTRRTLNRSAWGAAVTDLDHTTRIRLTAGPQVYEPTTGGQTVYGCYIVRPATGVVVLQRRFATPRQVEAGVSFSVNPIVTLRSEVYGS